MTDDTKAKYNAAIDTFFLEPEALSAEHIDLFKRVDDTLAERAIKKRDAMRRKGAEARHRAAIGEPPVKERASEQQMADLLVDHTIAALARPIMRIKTLEAQTAALEQQARALETAILELQAQLADRQAAP